MITEFGTVVLYTQIVIYRKGLPRPGLLWTDDHVAQGFAWDEEIVSFGVPDHDGDCYLRINVEDDAPVLKSGALWAIIVPFNVTSSVLEVGTIGIMRDINIPVGQYDLMFESYGESVIGGTSYTFTFDITFVKRSKGRFEILKKGAVLTTDHVLQIHADHG